MTLPAWPSVDDTPLVDGWSWEPYIPPLRTDMDGGNTVARSKPGSNVARTTHTYQFSSADFATLDAWWKTTLTYGASRFTGRVWNGSALVSKTLLIIDEPKTSIVGGSGGDLVRVSLTFLVFDV